ncbi:MarR family transcriptional regulator [Agrobacterium sp. 22-226-1]
MHSKRLQNIVGALALKIADNIAENTEVLAPRDDPAAAIALIGRSPRWTIRQLSNDLGLSHAATVRLVDRLVADSLMLREKSTKDGRAVELVLTQVGEQVYRDMLEARHHCLAKLLCRLSDEEREMLGKISEKLLALAAKNTTDRSRTCRLCDVANCKTCPMDIAVSI